jgi:hypothetical protein
MPPTAATLWLYPSERKLVNVNFYVCSTEQKNHREQVANESMGRVGTRQGGTFTVQRTRVPMKVGV